MCTNFHKKQSSRYRFIYASYDAACYRFRNPRFARGTTITRRYLILIRSLFELKYLILLLLFQQIILLKIQIIWSFDEKFRFFRRFGIGIEWHDLAFATWWKAWSVMISQVHIGKRVGTNSFRTARVPDANHSFEIMGIIERFTTRNAFLNLAKATPFDIVTQVPI